ncbi:hypothetical protein RN001_006033 [Aquatica leii]|uniref:Uncharacterized protein n=1 Tax=Aquatica leii TaxID=1421715 RepID=A0AAN7PD42_9COLE|nr:hypothetical protein RN001_006033 [Aquatica leii]
MEIFKTGGGNPNVQDFTDYEEKILNHILLSVDRLLSENDCDNNGLSKNNGFRMNLLIKNSNLGTTLQTREQNQRKDSAIASVSEALCTDNPIRVVVWKQACALQEGDDVSRLFMCSKHFKPEDYVEPNAPKFGGKLRLKPNVFPSVSVPNKINETTGNFKDSTLEETKDATLELSLIVDVEPSCSYEKEPDEDQYNEVFEKYLGEQKVRNEIPESKKQIDKRGEKRSECELENKSEIRKDFCLALSNAQFNINWSQDEIYNYLIELFRPNLDDTPFELMVPINRRLIKISLPKGENLNGKSLKEIFRQKVVYVRTLHEIVRDELETTLTEEDHTLDNDIPTSSAKRNNMNFVIIACLVAVASAARLESTYLPPSSAASAGGQGLSAPFREVPVNHFAASSAYKQISSAPIAQAAHASYPQAVYQEKYYPAQHQYNILRYENLNDGYGSYSYGYDTENHINVQESGQLKNIGTEHEANSVQGSYSYKGPDGKDYTVEYIADENGFQARGAHLPTPPPIPEAILKSLQLNAASSSDNDDGQYREAASSKQYIPPQKPAFDRYQGYNY